MGKPPPVNLHGARLCSLLSRFRVRAGLDQTDAGEKLHLTLQKISRIENGQIPGWHELDAILKLYEASEEETKMCHELREKARSRGWWHEYGVPNSSFVSVEDVALKITDFHIGRIPPLLQTEDYARQLAHCAESETECSTVGSAVEFTMRRQDRLQGADPLVLHTILHESVLRPGVDRHQLKHLISVADQPNVTLQIVGENVGLHPGVAGSVTLVEFETDDLPAQAYTRSLFGVIVHDSKDEVRQARATLGEIADIAMSSEDTIVYLESLLHGKP